MLSIIQNLGLCPLRRCPFATLAVVVALLLAACTAPASVGAPANVPTAEAVAGTVEVSRENSLIFASDMADLITLDPGVVYEYSGLQATGSVYETLVTFEPGKPEVQPLLAESWEIAESDDAWTVTFALNPNATFASGNPVTASDVVYSWGRVIDINKVPAYLFSDVLQVGKDNITAVDDHTLEVKLPKSVSPQIFLAVVSFVTASVLEEAALEPHLGNDLGESWLNDNSIGSGPYVLDKWERSTQITLNANPNYWGETPIMQRVIMQHVPELINLQAMIETGDADIVQDLGVEQAAALADNPDVQLVQADLSLFIYVGMNVLKPPLDNPDVREAIRYAINYDDFNTLLGGNGRVIQEIIPAGYLGHTGETYFTQDLDKAKTLLAQAGVAEGTEIEFTIANGIAPGGLEWSVIAAKIQSDLAQIGLVLNIRQLPAAEVSTIYRAQDGQMMQLLWGPDFPDSDGYVTPFTNYAAQSVAWRNAWDNPEIAELGKQAALEQDSDTRAQLYAEIVKRVAHEGPYLVLYQPARTFGVRSDVAGFVYDTVDTPGITFATIGKK